MPNDFDVSTASIASPYYQPVAFAHGDASLGQPEMLISSALGHTLPLRPPRKPKKPPQQPQ